MHTKRYVIGAVAGGMAVFVTGLILGVAFRGFYADALNAGSATGVARDQLVLWSIAVSSITWGALMTYVMANRPGALTTSAGIRTGAVVSFLMWFTADFMLCGVSHVGNLTSTAMEPLFELVPGAVAGGVIAVVLGRVQ